MNEDDVQVFFIPFDNARLGDQPAQVDWGWMQEEMGLVPQFLSAAKWAQIAPGTYIAQVGHGTFQFDGGPRPAQGSLIAVRQE